MQTGKRENYLNSGGKGTKSAITMLNLMTAEIPLAARPDGGSASVVYACQATAPRQAAPASHTLDTIRNG